MNWRVCGLQNYFVKSPQSFFSCLLKELIQQPTQILGHGVFGVPTFN